MKLDHTRCCALAFLSGVGNSTSPKELEKLLVAKGEEAQSRDWAGTHYDAGGQKTILVVTTPMEGLLENTLVGCGFSHILTFPRRKGYAGGDLKLWAVTF